MKDAKGHGSNPRGAAHQQGVEAALPQGVREIPLTDIYKWQDVNPELVETYRNTMRSGGQFPPISVVERMRDFDDRTSPKYSIRDGSHRYAAAQAEGLKTIRAKVL